MFAFLVNSFSASSKTFRNRRNPKDLDHQSIVTKYWFKRPLKKNTHRSAENNFRKIELTVAELIIIRLSISLRPFIIISLSDSTFVIVTLRLM